MKFRIWLDEKRHNEKDDGVDIEVDSDSAQEAVRQFAFERYCIYQHVDPGSCFVRYEDGTLMRWSMRSRVEFDVEPREEVFEMHHMVRPGVAACGADYPNMSKTETVEDVTCVACLRELKA